MLQILQNQSNKHVRNSHLKNFSKARNEYFHVLTFYAAKLLAAVK